MIKFVTFAVLAFAALAAAQETGSDEKEVALLLGNEQLFAPYCLKTRAEIVEDLQKRSRETSSAVFTLFFDGASEIADEVLSVQKEVVQELANSVSTESSEPVKDEPLPEDKVREMIEQGKQQIQRKGFVGRFVEATKTASMAIIGTANSALFKRLAKARSTMNASTLLSGIMYTCSQIDEYKAKLDTDLSAAKSAIKAEHSEPEIQKFVDGMTVADLSCSTFKFVSRLNFFCHVFRDGGNFFMKMLNLDYKLPTAQN